MPLWLGAKAEGDLADDEVGERLGPATELAEQETEEREVQRETDGLPKAIGQVASDDHFDGGSTEGDEEEHA